MTGEAIVRARDGLKTVRSQMELHWQELSRYFTPVQINPEGIPDVFPATEIMDTTGKNSALVMANGLASLVSPREEKWFEWEPAYALRKDDDAVSWYRQCSDIAQEYIQASNFYEEIQECYIDSPVYGTAALFCGDIDDYGELHFRQQRIGTYYFEENSKGRVVSFYRDLNLTAQQAADEFGEDMLDPEILTALNNPSSKSIVFPFVHAVFKRDVSKTDKGAPAKEKKPWASITVYEKTRKTVKEEGYEEFCFAVHRYRRFSGCVWGFGPGATAKGDCRQLEFLNKMADAMTERLAFPSVKAPASLRGEVGIGPGEITYGEDAQELEQLKEWAISGNPNILEKRIQDKQEDVKDAFHNGLFMIFADRQEQHGPLTATEANLLQGEKMAQFSPVYGRLVTEMLSVVLNRVFGILLRANLFPDPPDSVQQTLQGKPTGKVALPAVQYKNRIMLAQEAAKNQALASYLQQILPAIQIIPELGQEVIDTLNVPQLSRDVARNSGMQEAWLNPLDVIKKMKAARLAAQQQQQQMAASQQQSQTLENLGKAPPQAVSAAVQAQQNAPQ